MVMAIIIFGIFLTGLFLIGIIILFIDSWREEERRFKDDPYNYPPHNIKSFLRYLHRISPPWK